MPKAPLQQIRDMVHGEKRVLIALTEHPSLDAVAAGVSLCNILRRIGKTVHVVAHGFHSNGRYQALSGVQGVSAAIEGPSKLVISVRLTKAKADELSYDVSGETLNIFITPKGGAFTPEDVTIKSGVHDIGLIIALEAHDLESLGGLFTSNADLFYHTPLVNIDHRPINSMFGQVQYVDVTATSISEAVYRCIEEIGKQHLTQDDATNLLAGILSKTQSFQSSSVTPKSLSIAGELVAMGARREEIVRAMFRTKSIEMLRLWGRVLARIKSELHGRLIWSRLNRQDFEKSEGKPEDLVGVLDELVRVSPGAEIVAVLYETNDGSVEILVRTLPTLKPHAIFSNFPSEERGDVVALRPQTSSLDMAESDFRLAVSKVIQAHQ